MQEIKLIMHFEVRIFFSSLINYITDYKFLTDEQISWRFLEKSSKPREENCSHHNNDEVVTFSGALPNKKHEERSKMKQKKYKMWVIVLAGWFGHDVTGCIESLWFIILR